MVKAKNSASKKIEKYLNKQQKSKDFDIENEEINDGASSSDNDLSDGDEEELKKKEHYVSVGKSKIRQEIDDKNKESKIFTEGKKVNRNELFGDNNKNLESSSDEEEVSDEEEESEEEFHSFEENNVEKLRTDESASDDEDSNEMSSEEEPASLKPLSTFQQFVQLQSKDSIKGKSIIKQNKQFDSILEVRMQMQKAMSIYNAEYNNTNINNDLLHVAKENNKLLKDIIVEINKKRLHLHKQDHFTTKEYDFEKKTSYKKVSKTLNQTLERYNKVTLSKWSKKTLQADYNLIEHLDNVLLDKNKLISQLRQPKFNDLQFYKNLLNQLIQQKLNNTNSTVSGTSSKPIEIRLIKKDNSGNKSSKGRKLDYTVQQKLLNFETPNQNNSKLWDDFKRDEFFVGLFGRKVDIWSMDQDEGSSSENDEDLDEEEAAIANDGLQIFG
ncbi:hypothetical protein QEN19_001261 [Hanseniaspora menglaensis]